MSENTPRKTLIGAAVSPAPPGAERAPDGEPDASPRAISPSAASPVGATPTIELRPRRPNAGSAASDPFIGQELCGYRIRRKLAEGGMGVVYEAAHRKIGRRGAIKILKPDLCRSEDMVERFYQEARAVNAIRHENIIDIHDFGRDPSGRVFFVMEYLEGEPLSARIRRGPLPWSEALPILEQTLRALKAAHDKGIVHRDLKPDNLWLERVDGRTQVKLLDFGIAKLVDAECAPGTVTRTGSVTGTAHYMSPEQINGSKDVDQRTDLYAMGVIAYELFTGAPPFGGDTLQAVLAGHLFQDPPRLDDLPAELGVPQLFAEVVDQMLAKDPARRYGSASDVLADLHDVHAARAAVSAGAIGRPRTGPPRARRAAPAHIVAPPRLRRRTWLVVLGALAVGALGGGGLALGQLQRRPATGPVVVQRPRAELPAAPLRTATPQGVDREAARDTARGTLLVLLAKAEPAVRQEVADTFGRLRDRESLPALTGQIERDSDDAVRGHVADALGQIEAGSMNGAGQRATAPPGPAPAPPAEPTAHLLARLDKLAPRPLEVWYASALARLGDATATHRLLAYARSDDLAVARKAALTLADVSPPGDARAIRALRAILERAAELDRREPHTGIRILTRMAALRDADARHRLYAMLEHPDEGTRLAAAAGLAVLGDDGGRQVLHDALASQTSPNRLAAAVAQIALGEYGGFDLITAGLVDGDPANRRLAARGLGEIGEPRSLPALLVLTNDEDWTVRMNAAAAIIAIVGLDPEALAQASSDWARTVLDAQDPALRTRAASVLGELPARDAVPLLARAIADGDRDVRREAARSAGRMKTAEAASQLAAHVEREADPGVKEEQIKALGAIGAIGRPAAHDALARLAAVPGRLGVIAAGSLIAVGDHSGKARLDAAIVAPAEELRLAAAQAAARAGDPIVVATLAVGATDRVFAIRFAAALGLAMFRAEKALAVPVLSAALGMSDTALAGQAVAALTRLGENVKDAASLLARLLDSDDPAQRLAALLIACEQPVSDELRVLRRLVVDLDPDVRHAGVSAIEDLSARAREEAIKLYKALLRDADPVMRARAAGQLSRLIPPPTRLTLAAPPATVPSTAGATDPTAATPTPLPATVPPASASMVPPAPPPAPAAPETGSADPPALPSAATPTPAAAAASPSLDATPPGVSKALDEVIAADSEARSEIAGFRALDAELATAIAAPAEDDAATRHVDELATKLEEAAARVEAAARKAETAAGAAASVAGSSPALEATRLVAQARTIAQGVRAGATAVRSRAVEARDKARRYITDETGNPQIYVARAEVETMAGKFADAMRDLDEAAKLIRASGTGNANLDFEYARLYDQKAIHATDPADRRAWWGQAKDRYQRFTATGTGPRAHQANLRVIEITSELHSAASTTPR